MRFAVQAAALASGIGVPSLPGRPISSAGRYAKGITQKALGQTENEPVHFLGLTQGFSFARELPCSLSSFWRNQVYSP